MFLDSTLTSWLVFEDVVAMLIMQFKVYNLAEIFIKYVTFGTHPACIIYEVKS